MIDTVREEHHACTAGEVARQLKMNRDSVKYRVRKLAEAGLVTYTEVPGSLRIVDAGDQPEREVEAD